MHKSTHVFVYARSLDDIYDNSTAHTRAFDHMIDLPFPITAFCQSKDGQSFGCSSHEGGVRQIST
eukprot:4757504-Karenia_brevis.AAC.1